MIKVIGVKFRCSGRLYYFDPTDIEFVRGDKVIVETARGRELGTVTIGNRMVEDDEVVQPLKPVMRRATEEDIRSAEANKEKEPEAFRRCKEKIKEHGLEMKLVKAEYTFDAGKLIFYFTADGRIDFRELVKDLAAMFRTRIELRQIGVRDEAVIAGGIGICGRCLCCASYLNDFVQVSIKMAKEQNISLNPTKISGVCGRLMCCLQNEAETYEYLNSTLPNVGEEVIDKFEGRKGKVQSVNVLRQKVKVAFFGEDEAVEVKEFDVNELSGFKACAKNYDDAIDGEEEAALAEIIKEDVTDEEETGRGKRHNKGRNNHRGGNQRHNGGGQQSRGNGERQGNNANGEQRQHNNANGERQHNEQRGANQGENAQNQSNNNAQGDNKKNAKGGRHRGGRNRHRGGKRENKE